MIMWMTCAFGFLVAIMIIFMMVSGIILEYYFGYHAAFGFLVAIMIIFMMVAGIILEYYFGCHVAHAMLL